MQPDSPAVRTTAARWRRGAKWPLILLAVAALFTPLGLWLRTRLRWAGHDFDKWQETVRLYDSRYRDEKWAYDQFGELARAHRWKMYALMHRPFHRISIGRLDFGNSLYEVLYCPAPGRRIDGASNLYAGRIAFIEEQTHQVRSQHLRPSSKSELGILDCQGTVTMVPLEARFPVPLITLGERSVFFGELGQAYLYDMDSGRLERVFTSGDWSISKLELVGAEYLVLLLYSEGTWRMLILHADDPYSEVSSLGEITNVVVVGGRIVIQKDQDCFLYNPAGGVGEMLASGSLLCRWGEDEFLFCALEQGNVHYGQGALYRYKIRARAKELLWALPTPRGKTETRPAERKFYDYTKLIVSRDGRYLLLPFNGRWHPPGWTKHMGIPWLEYELYDVGTGKKRGAFLNPYEGRYDFEFLGWEESDQTQSRGGVVSQQR